MEFERCGQLFHQLAEDSRGGDVRRHHGQETVAAIFGLRAGHVLHDRLRHPVKRFPDQKAITVRARAGAELNHVGEEHRAVLALQQPGAPALTSGYVVVVPLAGGGRDGCSRRAIARVTVVSVVGRALRAPLVLLAEHDVQNPGVRADEGREVLGLHHQGPDHLQRYHRRRTHAHVQRPAFADQLAQTTYGQHAFAAALRHADLGPPAEDHHHVIGTLAFLHEPGAGRERPPGGYRPERFPLGRVQGIPEGGGRTLREGLS